MATHNAGIDVEPEFLTPMSRVGDSFSAPARGILTGAGRGRAEGNQAAEANFEMSRIPGRVGAVGAFHGGGEKPHRESL